VKVRPMYWYPRHRDCPDFLERNGGNPVPDICWRRH